MSKESSTIRVAANPAFRTRDSNPHQFLLYTAIEKQGPLVMEATPINLITRNYDIVHLHWADGIFNSRYWVRAYYLKQRLLTLMRCARWRGARIVWTIHNTKPHEKKYPDLQRGFWESFLSNVDGVIHLSTAAAELANERFPSLSTLRQAVIPRGHYRGCYPIGIGQADARAALGVEATSHIMLFFGTIRPYKNLEALIASFRQLVDDHCYLLIAGSYANNSMQLRSRLHQLSNADKRVRLYDRFIPKEEVQTFFAASDCVVLPYKDILNSGAAILALSMNRPVVLPQLGSNVELAQRVGDRWVHLYQGKISSQVLQNAAKWARQTTREDVAPLDTLDWNSVAAKTLNFYASLI